MQTYGYIALPHNRVFSGFHFGARREKCLEFTVVNSPFETAAANLGILTNPNTLETCVLMPALHLETEDENLSTLFKRRIYAGAVVLDNLNVNSPRFPELDEWLKRNNVIGIYGIDTYELFRYLCSHKETKAAFVCHDVEIRYSTDEDVPITAPDGTIYYTFTSTLSSELHFTYRAYLERRLQAWNPLGLANIFPLTLTKIRHYRPRREAAPLIVILDFGATEDLVVSLLKLGFEVVSLPGFSELSRIITYDPDGIVISSGGFSPPELAKVSTSWVEKLSFFRKSKIPVLATGEGAALLWYLMGGTIFARTRRLIDNQVPILSIDGRRIFFGAVSQLFFPDFEKRDLPFHSDPSKIVVRVRHRERKLPNRRRKRQVRSEIVQKVNERESLFNSLFVNVHRKQATYLRHKEEPLHLMCFDPLPWQVESEAAPLAAFQEDVEIYRLKKIRQQRLSVDKESTID